MKQIHSTVFSLLMNIQQLSWDVRYCLFAKGFLEIFLTLVICNCFYKSLMLSQCYDTLSDNKILFHLLMISQDNIYVLISNTCLNLSDCSRPSFDIHHNEEREYQKRISFPNCMYKLPFDQCRYSKFGSVQIISKWQRYELE